MSPSIIHRSREMVEVLALARRVAVTDANVLISGESGTGKSLLAGEIHRWSERRRGPFVTIPCANIPAELFESELFGHEPGAHTDATARRTGRFEAAQGGTIFLDGVGTLALRLQSKLLRVLQEKSFERLGGNETVRLDVRVVASAAERLESEVEAGRFREDLFYRLNVVRLDLPPLRERIADIVPLALALLRELEARHGGGRRQLSVGARKRLREYIWPGNIRELANGLESAIISGRTGIIEAEDLRIPETATAEGVIKRAVSGGWSLAALEGRYIREVLRASGGNKSRAAAVLGIDRKTLMAKLKRSGE